MAPRLYVRLEESELNEIRAAARQQRLTVAEWVRQALRAARARPGGPETKLAAVRAGARHAFPAGEVDPMLAEIETGYVRGLPR